MSGYGRNEVYTYVVNALRAEYPGLDCTSRYVPKPSRFPSVYIHEIDHSRPVQNVQLDFEDVQWESAFEIQVVSALSSTAASEAYAIMDVVRAAMSRLYYREIQTAAVDEATKFTVICRFRRVIGGGDTMPE